jgi:hypothetical protein
MAEGRIEKLTLSPCSKGRIRRRAVRDYQIGGHKNLPSIFNIASTSPHTNLIVNGDDYG